MANVTVIGGQWADRAQRGLPQSDDYASVANKRGVNVLLRICAIGMIWATPLTAACFFIPGLKYHRQRRRGLEEESARDLEHGATP